MSHPLSRYLACLVLPPLVGAVCLSLWGLAQEFSAQAIAEIAPATLAFALYGFVYCVLPAHLYFFAMEGIVRRFPQPFRHRRPYLLLGAALGLPCGVAIGIAVEVPELFTPIGAIAGAITAWATFSSRHRIQNSSERVPI